MEPRANVRGRGIKQQLSNSGRSPLPNMQGEEGGTRRYGKGALRAECLRLARE
ncbi:hypothetical protein IF1G_04727 [Cordyceps javanica]|uniref:Uncharacterized protein n=1 Tax=Cordyceps javanica TaxID=43265 RepID=A0A545V347_9HYPO|nr:hypothetical protein IF1G_04727 [Cordyceps javanica]